MRNQSTMISHIMESMKISEEWKSRIVLVKNLANREITQGSVEGKIL